MTIDPLVKICGLTRSSDVTLAVELGAWAVGFVFASSPRQVTAEQARGLVLAARESTAGRDLPDAGERPTHGPLAVGVFGDSSVEVVADVVDVVGLDAVQLHGARPDAAGVRRALGNRVPQVLIIRAIPVPAAGTGVAELREALGAARDGADFILLDTSSEGRWGGTGVAFPWKTAREASEGSLYLVAGGIGPHNVGAALEASGALGVDVSSGVEHSPGVKDETLLRALFARVAEKGRTS